MSTTKRKFSSFASALEFLQSSGCPTGAKLFSPSAFDTTDIYTVEYLENTNLTELYKANLKIIELQDRLDQSIWREKALLQHISKVREIL